MELSRYIKIYDDVISPTTIANIVKFGNSIDFTVGTVDKNTERQDLRSVKIKSLTNLSNSMTEVHWYNFLFSTLRNFLGMYNNEINNIRGHIITDIESIDFL